MALLEAAKRVLKYGEITLPDPGPDLDEKGVLAYYAEQYPELTTAGFSPPEVKVDSKGATIATFEIKKQVGTKG